MALERLQSAMQYPSAPIGLIFQTVQRYVSQSGRRNSDHIAQSTFSPFLRNSPCRTLRLIEAAKAIRPEPSNRKLDGSVAIARTPNRIPNIERRRTAANYDQMKSSVHLCFGGTYEQQPYQSVCHNEGFPKGPTFHELARNGSERFNLRLTTSITNCQARPAQRSSAVAPEPNSFDF
jgi:hypothetical protein